MRKPFLFLLTLLLPFSVQAQNVDYIPPPMFDDPTPPMVRPESQTGNIVEPKVSPHDSYADYNSKKVDEKPVAIPVSPKAPASPVIAQQPVSKMSPIIDGDPAIDKPSIGKVKKTYVKPVSKPAAPAPKVVQMPAPPPVKPQPPIAKNKDEIVSSAKTTDKELVPLSAAFPEKDNKPGAKGQIPTSAKTTSKGVVTGPKTMPAVPTQIVEEQKVYQDLTAPLHPEKTILELHQERVEEEKSRTEESNNIDKAPEHSSAPPVQFDETKQNVLKKTLPFIKGQLELPQNDLSLMALGIAAELGQRKGWRLLIKSYATPNNDEPNGERRIALSRVLSLRKALLEAGTPPNLIDVQAEGREPSGNDNPDRIDVYLFDPLKK
jgi:hypothetical protein